MIEEDGLETPPKPWSAQKVYRRSPEFRRVLFLEMVAQAIIRVENFETEAQARPPSRRCGNRMVWGVSAPGRERRPRALLAARPRHGRRVRPGAERRERLLPEPDPRASHLARARLGPMTWWLTLEVVECLEELHGGRIVQLIALVPDLVQALQV